MGMTMTLIEANAHNRWGNRSIPKPIDLIPTPHRWRKQLTNTAQKMKFSIKDLFSKCDQIRRKLRIWLHLLNKSLMENSTFCAK